MIKFEVPLIYQTRGNNLISLKLIIMLKASVIFQETIKEYFENGLVIIPNKEKKMMWLLYGYPDGVVCKEEMVEIEADIITGTTKREIKELFSSMCESGFYSCFGWIGFDKQLFLRFQSL